MKDRIRKIVCEEYINILGIVAYKNNWKVYEEYFNGANKEESVQFKMNPKSWTVYKCF